MRPSSYMSVGYMNWYWIYTANKWGIYVSWRLSVHPLFAGSGNVHYVIYIHFGIGYKLPKMGNICQLDI